MLHSLTYKSLTACDWDRLQPRQLIIRTTTPQRVGSVDTKPDVITQATPATYVAWFVIDDTVASSGQVINTATATADTPLLDDNGDIVELRRAIKFHRR